MGFRLCQLKYEQHDSLSCAVYLVYYNIRVSFFLWWLYNSAWQIFCVTYLIVSRLLVSYSLFAGAHTYINIFCPETHILAGNSYHRETRDQLERSVGCLEHQYITSSKSTFDEEHFLLCCYIKLAFASILQTFAGRQQKVTLLPFSVDFLSLAACCPAFHEHASCQCQRHANK